MMSTMSRKAWLLLAVFAAAACGFCCVLFFCFQRGPTGECGKFFFPFFYSIHRSAEALSEIDDGDPFARALHENKHRQGEDVMSMPCARLFPLFGMFVL